MQETLNFGRQEKPKLAEILSRFEHGTVTSYFEEMRAKRNGCTITLYESGKVSIQGANAAMVKGELMKLMDLKKDLIIGIDETGRGEKTGPMVITGVLADTNGLREVRDSKKTSNIAAKERIVSEKMLGAVSVTVNSALIDLARNNGMNLNEIEAHAMDKIAEILLMFGDARVVADGAPLRTRDARIKFMPKADDLEPVVGAASVIAKHVRETSADKGLRKTWNLKEKAPHESDL